MGHPVGVPGDPVETISKALLAGEALPGSELIQLVEEATATDEEQAEAVSKRLFRDIVEPLCDRFEPELSQSCDSFLTAVIGLLYNRSGFERFREGLDRSVLIGDDYLNLPEGPPARCLALSRVTLGADVAVTSVVLDGLKQAYPDAEIALACGAKVQALYQGDDRLSFLPVEYPRRGSLRDRLNAWVDLLDQIEQWAGGDLEHTLVVNPDSRLTQLGVLPAAPKGGRAISYDSRSFGGDGDEPIAELTSRWARMTFGVEGARPYVAPAPPEMEAGKALRGGAARLAAMNWGFGGNESKRVSAEFETQLVFELLGRGWRVVLDKGSGEIEASAAEATERAAAERGFAELELFEGPLSGFAGVIAASDLFVGYDSAAGHIAAALGVPGTDVFRGAVSERMLQRWSPWGKRPGQVVAVRDEETPEQVLARVAGLLP